ncbi:MAG TPA: CdaR family protein [Methylomirabilota bacterium]|jgi:YbbR domain-containing protein|nr:CdaR family protein [Methylomirabilota bacterium]
MRDWLLNNWGLKVLAMAVAAVVWFFVVGADRSQIGFAAPIEYVGLEGMRVVLGTPRETADVQLEAARWAAARVTPASVRVRVDVSKLGEGEHVVQLSTQQVEAPPGVQVVRIWPSAVRLSIAGAAVRTVRVVPQIRGTPAAEHALGRVVVDPQIVQVKGPRTTIEGRTTVETAPIDVSGIRRSITQTVGLLLPESVYATTQRTVQVTVEIQPEDSMHVSRPGATR